MGVYIIGAGGHAKVVLSTLLDAGIRVDGFFDDDPGKQGLVLFGVRVIGTIADAKAMSPQTGVIGIGDNRLRKRLAQELAGWEWLCVVHSRAYVHPSATLGPGTVIFAGAVVQPCARLGSHVIVNTGATVDHDCVVEDFVHLAPGVHLAGSVVVEEGAFLGIGSVVTPGIRVGSWTVVGAGGVVIRDLPPSITAAGVPARPLLSSGGCG
jgi:sugar O-acyltransferase (sialic acid O-acetyltransferase NeuD family)